MEVTKKMTSGNDIVLKSWLRTLRYSIEYYEDTFDSKNNRRSENNQLAKNMVIGGDSSDDSEDGHYVNVWDCSHRGESASKLKNSLESVGNTSEVSNFGSENTSLNTVSGTDLSSGSYCLEEVESVRENFGEHLKTTDLDDNVVVKRTKKKPVAAPRLSKSSDTSEAIYVNLPLITRNSRDSTCIAESTENCNLRTQSLSETSHIYENLPLIPRNSKEPIFTSSDSLKFEEEVYSTIQYLEDVIESVDTCSDDSDSEDIETRKNPIDKFSFDSNCSTISSNFDDICLSPQTTNDKKFTESTSSFEEYLGTDESRCEENDADSLNQRFAKDNRVSAFFEEQEPGPPQEVKNIPIPKNKTTRFDCSKRFSVPLRFTEQREKIQRPQSLGNKIVNINCHSIFEILALDIEENNKTKLLEEKADAEDSTKEELESFDTFETSLREKVNSSAVHLNLSFAKESRISSVFEEGIVEELQLPESIPENSILQEKCVGSLSEHVVFWMTSLMECCGELENIMEEKVI